MKKKKIAFIELETHANILLLWYRFFKAIETLDYHFYIHHKLKQKVTGISNSKITFIDSVSQLALSDFNLVIVNTFHRNFRDFKLIFKNNKTLCLLHNLNFSLSFDSINFKNIFYERESFLYFLKLYLKEKIAKERFLIKDAVYLAVLSTTLATYARSKKQHEELEVLNLNYNRYFLINKSNVIKIVIPGNVSNKRKNYDLVFNVILNLKPVTKMEFVFLGNIREKSLKRKLVSLKNKCSKKITITFYEDYVPEEEYQDEIKNAHLLFCPVKSNTSFYWVDEFYGKTKVSGNESDCISYGKIGIFPSYYPEFNWLNITYNNENELIDLFNNLNIQYIDAMYGNLKSYINQYQFENIKYNIENKINNLIDKKV